MTEQPRGFRLESLSKSYGPVRALRDVGFDVPQGQVVGLVGENGAGKSTLLRILLGQIRPDAGEVRDIDGSPFDLGTPSGARAVGVRVVQQEPEIVPWLSLAENLYLGELPRRFSKAALNAMARRHLDALGFGRDLDVTRRAQELTPAQRQLAEIARALKPGVRLLAFDEPTSSLSEDETERLLRIIEDLRTQGLAIVYVSHRLREVTRLADRIAVLRDGQLVAERTAGTTPDELVRLMVGRPLGSWLQHTDNTRGQVLLRVEGLRAPGIIHADLTVRAGEVVGLSGLIGAGRTELAHAICGVTRPTGGTVTFDGKPVAFRHPSEAMAVGLAYAPEERKKDALFLDRSVLENVTIAANRKLAHRRFLRRADQVRMAEDLRQRLRIKTHSLKTPIRNLSGGNQQKVVLARLIATGPRLLVLDEPTRGIDVGAKQEIYELIEQMTRAGMGVLLISSELPELLALSDRVVVIREGRSVAELPGTEATEEVVLALSMPSSTDDISATGAA